MGFPQFHVSLSSCFMFQILRSLSFKFPCLLVTPCAFGCGSQAPLVMPSPILDQPHPPLKPHQFFFQIYVLKPKPSSKVAFESTSEFPSSSTFSSLGLKTNSTKKTSKNVTFLLFILCPSAVDYGWSFVFESTLSSTLSSLVVNLLWDYELLLPCKRLT